ncbi:phosphosulfolactate synthase [Thermoactinomyces sp. DSM 45891]|uniref:phosphosulfolactate synthase n=1 Tax=Thermoactinomyces sp. DSM 45891 TaxID=1761907 RepID=UPI00091DDDD0|nr:phosphosulfolactate synthase [Thermoactinomyces sp. DSM 45891]SFX06553.1 phosphosulfolactate synthase [Thermoactinomyces sp. DSM 45891]
MERNIWGNWLQIHTKHRQINKPRSTGLTMVMDKGLGMRAFDDLIEIAHPYIDFYKLGFGTAAVTPVRLLREKIERTEQERIHIYPGGTFFEIAHHHRCTDQYFQGLRDQGIRWIEISEGTISIPPKEKRDLIRKAHKLGFSVITEIGKKESGTFLTVDEIHTQAALDLEEGVKFVIIEGRESGIDVGIYDENGKFDSSLIRDLANSLPLNQIMFESPLKKQQIQYIKLIGNEVNLGNIPPTEVIALEALRQHLRSDTFNPTMEVYR